MARSWKDRLTFGGYMPWAVGLVLALTIGLSLPAAFITRHGVPLFAYGSLSPALVWKGQLFRLFTWPFLQPSPLGLIIECLMIFWFGRSVAEEWGSRTFLRVFGAVLLGASIATCLIARVDPAVLAANHVGSVALTTAIIVAWGLTFPDRIVRIYFVLPIRGFWLAWFTVAVTVIYAVYIGWQTLLPELFSEAFILVYLYRASLTESFEARRAATNRKREREKKRARSVAYLRLVDSREDKLPGLPPDIERKLRGGPKDSP